MILRIVVFGGVIIEMAWMLPEWRPLLPPLAAIGLAFLTRRVIVALFCGIWVGAALILLRDGGTVFTSVGGGFFRAADQWVITGLNDPSHLLIIVFTALIGGMTGILAASGGIHALVALIARKAKNRIGAQLAAYATGVLMFFDDYSSTIVTGSAFRPLTDRWRVSREKLSFVVDSTSAPIASVSILSTWIGYELGLIADAFKQSNIELEAYNAFLASIPYRFYALLLLVMVPVSVLMRRELGPMRKAEERTLMTGVPHEPGGDLAAGADESQLPPADKRRWYDAVLPVAVMVFSVLGGLVISGLSALAAKGATSFPLRDILSSADSFTVLMWAALLSTLTAGGLVLLRRTLDTDKLAAAWLKGLQMMLPALMILTLAWTLGAVTKDLGTAEFISRGLSGVLSAGLLPAAVFLAAAVTSFATGTSWGTMAILFPTVIPLAAGIAGAQGMDGAALNDLAILTVGAVLTGSIFGDHCSPVSDTTVMSAMYSGLPLMDHVRTQLPYALLYGTLALLLGYLPAGFGVNPLFCLALQIAAAVAILRFLGVRTVTPAS
ncbi:MAG TPA: Na+/H+ antiporter NhaC family protein [bacterium]|nr:Na+/H+ antiporter NhaC family protein [bacterium]